MVGIDTSFLVDLEMLESPRHQDAFFLFDEWRAKKTPLAVFYQVFLEFQDIVTDSKRVKKPLTIEEAVERTWFWAEQERVKVLYPSDASFKRALVWLNRYNLERKHLFDVHLAAVYAEAGVSELWTANKKNFEVFRLFDFKNL